MSAPAREYFQRAIRARPDWNIPQRNLAAVEKKTHPSSAPESNGFLVIKAWGYGFWSDVTHVLGSLLLSEITDRIPIVHWGNNSLFSSHDGNAFTDFFLPASPVTLRDVSQPEHDFFPPKWNHENLERENNNKWQGTGSRAAGVLLLNRPERVVVADFYIGVIDLIPWIPPGHFLHGLKLEQVYSYLVEKYLKPVDCILHRVDDAARKFFSKSHVLAAHIRGSDKIKEQAGLKRINQESLDRIHRALQADSDLKLYLMTDSTQVHNEAKAKFGKRVISTDSTRTDTTTGVHYTRGADKKRLGMEVMLDTYLATRATSFIGNGNSNVSAIIEFLKTWDSDGFHLISPNILKSYNLAIH